MATRREFFRVTGIVVLGGILCAGANTAPDADPAELDYETLVVHGQGICGNAAAYGCVDATDTASCGFAECGYWAAT